MTEAHTLPITVDDAWLAMQSAGTLSPFKQLLLTCQAEMCPSVQAAFSAGDHIGGALLESAKGADLSDDFIQRLSARIDQDTDRMPPEAGHASTDTQDQPEWMPAALADYMRRSSQRLKWRHVGGGVQQARLGRSSRGERLYLLRAHPGLPVPRHSHSGQEWTLVLSGGYTAGDRQYAAGDLHQEDETCLHDLRIDDDGPCVSLIVDEGKLRFANPLLKLLQPVLGL